MPEHPASALLVGRSPPSPLHRWPRLHRAYWALHSEGWDRGIRPGARGQVVVDWVARAQSLAGARVLDLGCGTGVHALGLARLGAEVVALDFSRGMLRQARRRARRAGVGTIVFRRADFDDGLPLGGESFDTVLGIGILHCAGDPGRLLHEVARVLRPGGRLFLGVVRARPGRRRLGTPSACVFRVLRTLPGWTRRVRTCGEEELGALLGAAGFEVRERLAMAGLSGFLAHRTTGAGHAEPPGAGHDLRAPEAPWR